MNIFWLKVEDQDASLIPSLIVFKNQSNLNDGYFPSVAIGLTDIKLIIS
jgi:hypothetical protein